MTLLHLRHLQNYATIPSYCEQFVPNTHYDGHVRTCGSFRAYHCNHKSTTTRIVLCRCCKINLLRLFVIRHKPNYGH